MQPFDLEGIRERTRNLKGGDCTYAVYRDQVALLAECDRLRAENAELRAKLADLERAYQAVRCER